MNLDRRIKIQLAVFTVIAVIAAAVMILHYINAPAVLFGVGRYTRDPATAATPPVSTRAPTSPIAAPKSAASKASS